MSFLSKFKMITRHGCFFNQSYFNQSTTTSSLVDQRLYHSLSYVDVQQSLTTKKSALVLSELRKRSNCDTELSNSNKNTNSTDTSDKEEIFLKIKARNNESRQGVRWGKEEEQEVIAKEIQFKRENPSISEKEMNKKLSLAFNNTRTTGSYAARRQSSRWKLMVKNQNDIWQSLKANVENQDLRPDPSKFQDSQATEISREQLACYSPSEKTLEEMGDALRYEETYSSILEHEAKGIL